MIRLLRFLITGDWHLHVWETKAELPVYAVTDDGERVGKCPQNIQIHCQCKTCGQWKKFRF